MRKVGLLYDNGEGVPEDNAEAVNWYRKAAGQGFADAQAKLGVIYLAGEGVPEDYVQGYAWLTLAAARGNNDATQGKSIIGKLMTPAQIAKARELSKTSCATIPGCAK
jgi:TPR repeat protein